MKLAIDMGNRNINVCYKDGAKLNYDIFQARFTSEEQQDYSTLEVLELGGVKYCIEQGDYDFEFNKTEKNYLPLLLTAIARSCHGVEVELMLGVPCEHVNGLRAIFKEQLEGKTFEFKYKGFHRVIKITRIGIIGEGFASYFAIPKTTRGTINNLGIIDIGGRTTNIATFIAGKQHKVCSLNFGILDVKNDILKTYKNQGRDYDITDIENLIDTSRATITDTDKQKLIDKIMNRVKLEKIDIDLYDWFLVGGGSEDIGKELLDKHFGKDCMFENPLYANVLGYHNFMIAKWGE